MKTSVSLNKAVVTAATSKIKLYNLDTWHNNDTALVSNEARHRQFEHADYNTIVSMPDGNARVLAG